MNGRNIRKHLFSAITPRPALHVQRHLAMRGLSRPAGAGVTAPGQRRHRSGRIDIFNHTSHRPNHFHFHVREAFSNFFFSSQKDPRGSLYSLDSETRKTFSLGLILTRLDYCNSRHNPTKQLLLFSPCLLVAGLAPGSYTATAQASIDGDEQ